MFWFADLKCGITCFKVIFMISEDPTCQRVYIGQMGVTFQRLNSQFKFTEFADTLLSVCQDMCGRFSQISPHEEYPGFTSISPLEECLGFSYHKVTHVCNLAVTTRYAHEINVSSIILRNCPVLTKFTLQCSSVHEVQRDHQ